MDDAIKDKCREIFKKPAREWNDADYAVLNPLIATGQRQALKDLRKEVQAKP